MNRFMMRSLVVLVPVCVALGTTWACCPKPDTKSDDPSDVIAESPLEAPDKVHEARFEVTKEPKSGDVSRRVIKPITVKRGEAVEFPLQCDEEWVLIPDGNLRKYSGGSEWARTHTYIAFKVDLKSGTAVVMVPRNYPASTDNVEIGYSILCLDDAGYHYIEGDSPPRMIIPPFP